MCLKKHVFSTIRKRTNTLKEKEKEKEKERKKKAMNRLKALDIECTEWLHQHIGLNKNKYIARAPYYLGLLPYELYVLPGMFVAIATMFYYETFHPVQFHLLPHWFAFSISLYLKHNISRIRPGCINPRGKGSLIDPHHCEGSTKYQSFPSGHTIIAFALATSLTMYLQDSSTQTSDKVFMGIPFGTPSIQTFTVLCAYFVASMISIHRVSYGYHHVSDVMVGAVMGSAIGYTSHVISNKMRNVSSGSGSGGGTGSNTDDNKKNAKVWGSIRVAGMILAFLAVLHFFVYKFHKLSALQH